MKMKKFVFTLFVIITGITINTAQTEPTTLTKVGDNAPFFSCKTINGEIIDISKSKGKIVMINFFATWCGPCNMELPLLQKNIWEKYKNRSDFVLIILGREHSETEVRDFVKSKKYTMPFAPDPNREVFKLYAASLIPRNIIIGKDGRIIFQNMGYSEEEFKKIEVLLAEKLK